MQKLIISSLILFFLSACSSTQNQVNIVPKPKEQVLQPQYQGIKAKLSSRDIREANYLIAIHKAGNASQLINNQASLAELAEANLRQGWQQQGITFTQNGAIDAKLEIQVARIDVKQDVFEYEAKSSLILSLTITNKDQTLTKQYQRTSTMTGALNVSIPALEEKFAQQLSAVLDEIYQDKQVNQYITF